jgi:hypothetical protein
MIATHGWWCLSSLYSDRELVGLQPITGSGGYDSTHFRGFLCDAVCPQTVAAFSVYRRDPPLGSRPLHILKRVVAFSLQDDVKGEVAFQSDDEVRHVVMHLSVVQVRDGESEPRVLHERSFVGGFTNVVRPPFTPQFHSSAFSALPEWQRPFQDALLEVDPKKLDKCVEDAETAILRTAPVVKPGFRNFPSSIEAHRVGRLQPANSASPGGD